VTQLSSSAGTLDVAIRPRPDFSLVLGGPLYQLLLRCRLSRPAGELVHRRVVAFALFAWLPLLALASLEGHLFGGVDVPFLRDPSTHVRFLLALPLLIGAELVVHERIRAVVEQFKERGLITPEDEPRFDAAIDRAVRLRNSVTAETILLLLSFTFGYWVWSNAAVLSVPTWYGRVDAGVRKLTPAGYWFAFISLPVFRFILVRWYFRLVIWYRFLWSVSRLRLRLNPLHPDRSGGLGFLSVSPMAFLPVLIAHSVLLAGVLGDRIWHAGAKLRAYEMEILTLVACLIVLVLAPLCFFVGHLLRSRRAGMRRYGLLASRYVDDFENKWLASPGRSTVAANAGGEPLLGAADIQSLADLGNSFDVVREMKPLPFGKDTVIRLAVVILLPISPLVLTMIPLRDLIERLLKMAV
jgi:hypothetical protein